MPGFNPFDVTTKRVLKKLGGDKNQTKAFVLPEVSLAEDAETPGFTVYRDLSDATPFELGKTYTVHLDSGSYECVAKAMDGIGNVLGNTAFGGGDDTGETFLVAITEGIAMVMDANCGTKASVTTTKETIVPIDQKYLGVVCLPVVELSTVPTAEGAKLTADEVAKIIEVFVPGMPIIATVPLFEGMTMGVVMSGMVEDGVPLLGGQIMIANAEYRFNVMVTNDDALFTVTTVNG